MLLIWYASKNDIFLATNWCTGRHQSGKKCLVQREKKTGKKLTSKYQPRYVSNRMYIYRFIFVTVNVRFCIQYYINLNNVHI